MDGYKRRKEQNKEKIIRAAIELVRRLGIDKTNISDIAREAGVSQVTIYNLFGSKDDLLISCMEYCTERFIDEFNRLIKAKKTYQEKVEDIFDYFIEQMEAQQNLDELGGAHYPELMKRLDTHVNRLYGLFMEFIKDGQREGYLNPDLSEEAIRAYIEIFIRGMNADTELHQRTHHDAKLFHDLLQLLLFGLARVERPLKNPKIHPAK